MMNESEYVAGREPAVALPDHLRGRLVSLNPDNNRLHIREPGGEPNYPQGTVEDWWPVLTQEQQAAIIMASIVILSEEQHQTVVGDVSLHWAGEISLAITTSQRQEYFDLHPKK